MTSAAPPSTLDPAAPDPAALFQAAPAAMAALDAAGRVIALNDAAGALIGALVPPCDWPAEAALTPDDSAARAAGPPAQAARSGRCVAGARYLLRGAPVRMTLSAGAQGYIALLAPEAQADAPARLRDLETLARVASGVAHDVNNLLSVVIGALELAAPRADADARARRSVETALAAARTGGELIAKLLGPARAGAQSADLAALLEELSRLGAASVGPAIRFRVAAPGFSARVQGERARLLTALLNLVVNARDAILSSGQGRHVAVTARRCDNRVEIAVSDDGPGMSAEVFARALDPFFSTKTGARRSGLGLTLAHDAARRCGGDLQIASEPGGGVTVRMTLPLLDLAPAP